MRLSTAATTRPPAHNFTHTSHASRSVTPSRYVSLPYWTKTPIAKNSPASRPRAQNKKGHKRAVAVATNAVTAAMTNAAHPFEDPADPIASSQMGDANDAEDMVMDLQGASQWSEPILTPTPVPAPAAPSPLPVAMTPAEPQISSVAPDPTPPTPGALGAQRMTRAMTRGLKDDTPRPKMGSIFSSTPATFDSPPAQPKKRRFEETPSYVRLVDSTIRDTIKEALTGHLNQLSSDFETHANRVLQMIADITGTLVAKVEGLECAVAVQQRSGYRQPSNAQDPRLQTQGSCSSGSSYSIPTEHIDGVDD
ncbi:hypothetical protein FN846DRAFT_889661 [Sphaerosporella brunnea]|uniref:Uncharacterized protein n=1 Tax=Sphaerosporella brunnea TaxID=1250544 RepID=A0A5J5EYG8_9PEZI|nr:hypothetical protein FN846DRAFT_889661 [Sphaerosporella brunnea]